MRTNSLTIECDACKKTKQIGSDKEYKYLCKISCTEHNVCSPKCIEKINVMCKACNHAFELATFYVAPKTPKKKKDE